MKKYRCIAKCPELDSDNKEHCTFTESYLNGKREYDQEICPCGNVEKLELVKDEYDMDALYLYNDGWQYKIGQIEKVNDKSIRMDRNFKILKENFDKLTYKLTNEEIETFNKLMVKKLSGSISDMRDMIDVIKGLKTALQSSELVCVDSSKLQNKLDVLNDALEEQLTPIEIGGKKLKFHRFTERLIEVRDE